MVVVVTLTLLLSLSCGEQYWRKNGIRNVYYTGTCPDTREFIT